MVAGSATTHPRGRYPTNTTLGPAPSQQGRPTITTTTTGQALHEERLAVLHLMRRHQIKAITADLVDQVARIILTMKGE